MAKKSAKIIKHKFIQPYVDIPFKFKFEHVQFPDTGEEFLSDRSRKLIKHYRKEMINEHFGYHVIKQLPNKDGWKKLVAESGSLLGEAPKGILENAFGERFIYKEPKVKDGACHGFKESLSELIITELSRFFTLTAAASLVTYRKKIVFLSKLFLNSRYEELVHGTALFISLYDQVGIEEVQGNRNKQRKFYTIEHIIDVFSQFLKNKNEFESVIESFCMMILTDCFTGNQDRHAENWGLIRNINDNTFRFSPLFDNARGLFWNSSVLQLAQNMHSKGHKMIEDYINESRPMISLNANSEASHFDLLEKITEIRPEVVKKFRCRLMELDINRFIMKFRPQMSPLRYSIIIELLKKRRKRMYEKMAIKGIY